MRPNLCAMKSLLCSYRGREDVRGVFVSIPSFSERRECRPAESTQEAFAHSCFLSHFISTSLDDRHQQLLKTAHLIHPAVAAAKSLRSCPTLCDPIDSSPSGCSVPGILQARILEWVAISFSNAWKWEVKVKSLSRVQFFTTPWTIAFFRPWDFPGKSTGVGCHFFLHDTS